MRDTTSGRQLSQRSVLLLIALVVVSCAYCSLSTSKEALPSPQTARSANNLTAPVAMIAPLDDVISNGTWHSLDGSGSYDPPGMTGGISNYTWELTYQNATTVMYGATELYKFTKLGLYKIKLTVWDFFGNSGVNFTAVISVSDVDYDELPDWWERYYLDTLDEGASDDNDDDGWTNLQEYAAGTNPAEYDMPLFEPEPTFFEKYWAYIAVVAAVLAALAAVLYSRQRKKQKESERKKIEYAIEIEKSLQQD